MHQIWVPPSKRALSATVVQSSERTVADRHRLAAHHNKHCWRALRGYKHRWSWTTFNLKIGVFSDFSIKGRFQRCEVWPPRFKESVQMNQIWVPPSKRAVSATVVQSSKRTVAYRHRLAAHHNKHCWQAFRGYQHRWPWTTLNPKIRFLLNF